jgi:hypothetical protein
MLSVVDAEEKVRSFLPIVEQMVEEGLVVLSDVDIIKYSYRAFEVNEDKLPTQSGENSV